MKLVGITCSLQTKPYDGARNYLNRTYSNAIEAVGGVPLILPVTSNEAVLARSLDAIDGLLLTGGVDVHPSLYREVEHPELGTVDHERDANEIALIRLALAQNKPIFAICRGLQILNVALGGSLYQDLPSQKPTEIHHSQRDSNIPRNQPTHTVEITPGSRLAALIGGTHTECNSLHHQSLKDIGAGLVVTGYAPDGIVEGAEMPQKRFVVGVQYHPEDTFLVLESSRRLFEGFLASLS